MTTMANESALIIPIPDVEPIVSPLRLQYDRAALLGVPAHVTLLYPFRPADSAIDEVEKLTRFCSSVEAFSFSFIEVRRFPATVYLHPDKSERFVQITEALVRLWPDCRPYGGAFTDIVPHLTVADKVDVKILDEVESFLRPQVPIKCIAREILLITCDEAGMWSTLAHSPFSAKQA
jgi:2'-5' RNA ligase